MMSDRAGDSHPRSEIAQACSISYVDTVRVAHSWAARVGSAYRSVPILREVVDLSVAARGRPLTRTGDGGAMSLAAISVDRAAGEGTI
jgi:hypothetical protein